jgi:hypothetical protein
LGFIGAAKHLGLALEEISELLGVWQSGACFEVKAELHPRIEAILPAAALNLIRLDARLTGAPLANTRTSHFSQLAVTLAA